MVERERFNRNKLLHRIIKILLIVVLGLLIIYGTFYALSKKEPSLSPQICEEKVWCLDYNTLAVKENNCVVRTTDCSEKERCLNGECVLRN